MRSKNKASLTIVQMNDTHAYFDIHQEMFWQGNHAEYRLAGGFARIATIVKQIRAESEGNCLFCDSGDTLHGTYPALATQGKAMIPILNALGIDAMSAHWEFAFDQNTFNQRLAELVGETSSALNRGTNLETTMDNFLLQALLESTGAQLAFSNGWRYGAPIVPGNITLNDLYNIIPGNQPVSTTEISGEELREMLEENLERTFSCDAYHHMGGYIKRC